MDSKNLTIGFLATTAVILLTGLLVMNSTQQPVLASGMTAQGGSYILTTGQFRNNEEIVYAIDSSKGLMLSYRYDNRSNSLVISGPPVHIDQLRPDPNQKPSKHR